MSADSYYKEMSLEEVGQYILFLYGGSGSGKTTLAAQFPDPLFISVDAGAMGGLLSAVSQSTKPIKQVKLTSYSQLLQLYPLLERDAKKVFQTLVIDSLTSLNQLVIRDILSLSAKETPVFADWNLAVARMRNMINKTASFGCHLIFTATEQIQKDEMTGKMMGLPNLPGKLAQEAPAGVDIVIRTHVRSGYDPKDLTKRKVTYVGSTAPDDIWYAKDRSATLPPELVLTDGNGKPTFKPLEHLFEKKGEEK
ncbi:MAG: ATP-binding protein [bacterium]